MAHPCFVLSIQRFGWVVLVLRVARRVARWPGCCLSFLFEWFVVVDLGVWGCMLRGMVSDSVSKRVDVVAGVGEGGMVPVVVFLPEEWVGVLVSSGNRGGCSLSEEVRDSLRTRVRELLALNLGPTLGPSGMPTNETSAH